MSKFQEAIQRIDQKNAEDPNVEKANGKEVPKELLYSQRMTDKLLDFHPQCSEELQIAVRAQHICRWKVPRDTYPMNRVGYLKWREGLKKTHAAITDGILEEVGYDKDFRDRVSFLIKKKQIKKDEGSQIMEDVVCLVFMEHYFEEFAAKHKDEKIIDIVKKTWAKMSPEGHEAAMKLPLSKHSETLIKEALK
ncbi:DUF4202 domain-containing protein [Salegentibacter sp. JZCK2]|uniref:DUF4202 domain-containing protein n=1 Tax=Salegentibacter tibetensis TaxID=2873600 RepID=UPI001CCE1A02|nr:DUF4202 domain-containing protein [Salegentibacter tibetensis]MBZ9730627.1 DUF4202 domain-containing protein [Salegentibacter tibetensis]